MIFSRNVRGLERGEPLTHANYPELHQEPPYLNVFDAGESNDFYCMSLVDGELVPVIHCIATDTVPYEYATPVASVAANVVADYYSVAVYYIGPQGAKGGHEGCGSYFGGPSTGGIETCWPPDPPNFYTTVEGEYVSPHQAIPVTSEGEAPAFQGTTFAQGQSFILGRYGFDFHSIEYGAGAYLLNDTPLWPTPDEYGNEFGKVLFTLEQLPDEIAVLITARNTGFWANAGPGYMEVMMSPYNVVEEEEEPKQILYVGEA